MLVTKILKLNARVRADQRARRIKLPKLIEQFACRLSLNNNKPVSRASYPRLPPDNPMFPIPVYKTLSRHRINASQIAAESHLAVKDRSAGR
jgi:hypothetical protein